MSWLEFTAAMTEALAWPCAVVVVVLLFKRQVLGLIPELRKFRFKEFELEFRESLKQAEKAIEAAKPPPPATLPERERLSRLLYLAGIAPRAAILEAWLEVEAAAARALARAQRTSSTSAPRLHLGRVGAQLVETGALRPELRKTFESLRTLRNRAVHVPDAVFDYDEVAAYVDVADSLVRHLEAA